MRKPIVGASVGDSLLVRLRYDSVHEPFFKLFMGQFRRERQEDSRTCERIVQGAHDSSFFLFSRNKVPNRNTQSFPLQRVRRICEVSVEESSFIMVAVLPERCFGTSRETPTNHHSNCTASRSRLLGSSRVADSQGRSITPVNALVRHESHSSTEAFSLVQETSFKLIYRFNF